MGHHETLGSYTVSGGPSSGRELIISLIIVLGLMGD